MQVIPTKVHAVLDYGIGIALIAVSVFFLDEGAAAWVPLVIGVLILGQSLMTNYELSMANLIPMPVHLGMDVLAGIILAASPWLFGFAELIWWPHLVVGLIEIGTAALTERHRRDPITYPNPPRGAAKV